ncbi:hypothetical protein COLO4_07349 [Corchorus olitorius]|uniref:Uncharacterized protein n=1 Tax=Corchorus olitorius TaxID=93759 RepID=A0A1R3KK56_9ROSI|nr:hypothetical protein COLO4_07349 [Corchorus olitorius]
MEGSRMRVCEECFCFSGQEKWRGFNHCVRRECVECLSSVLKDKPKKRMLSWLQLANSPGIFLSL